MRTFLLGSVLFAVLSVIVVSCGKESSTTSVPTYSYAGPGSKYGITLNSDLTFTLTHAPDTASAVDLTVTGTYSRLSSGFLLLTVSSSVGTGGPSAGAQAYGLEVPGFAVLLKPVGSDGNVIPMVVAGACPTADFNANWLMVKKDAAQAANSTMADFFGTFAWNNTTSSATLPAKYALEAFTSLGTGTAGSGTCSNGIMTVGGNANMYLTSAGGAIVHTTNGTSGTETDDSFIFGFPQDTLTSGTQITGNYAGVVFDDNASSGSRISPVSMTLTGTASGATGTGTKFTDVSTGALSSNTVSITLSAINNPSNGFMTGTLGGNEFVCMVDLNSAGSGKNLINCIGQSTGDVTKMFNVLLVSK